MTNIEMIDYFYQVVGPGDIVSWSATLNVAKDKI